MPAATAQASAAPPPAEATVAPWPLVDRYPTVIGSALTMAHVSAILRLATTGYRREYVDLLDELLEREPHGYAVLAKRVLLVAGARVELEVPDLAPDDPRREIAEEIRDAASKALDAIPSFSQARAELAWAVYTGLSGQEISWVRDESGRWTPGRLHFIHSRRLAYPDPSSWSVRIWDQGAVKSWFDFGASPTSAQWFGIRADDYPGKFIIHAAQIRNDYPTRDGLGRQLVWWFALKGMASRTAGQYIERFAKPWPMAYYATQNDGTPRTAQQEDIDQADAALAALAVGSGAGAVLPDTIKIDLAGPGVAGKSTLTPAAFIELINGEISKCVLGETLTTESGPNGNRAAAEVHKRGSVELARYDAACLAETLRRDLVAWFVRLNWPEHEVLCPRVVIHVDEKPDPLAIVDLAAKAAASGVPVDADALASQVGLPLVPQKPPKDVVDAAAWEPTPRRMGPLKPMTIGELDGERPPEPAVPPPTALNGIHPIEIEPTPEDGAPPN